MNSILIHGRLVRDPELRTTGSGIPVASFTVAVDRRFTPKGQEKQADFIDCVAWRGTGEVVSKHFKKGQEILVRGSLQSRKWKDKNDNNRISWEIIVDEISFCGPKSNSVSVSADRYDDQGPAPSHDDDFHDAPPGSEDDLPF